MIRLSVLILSTMVLLAGCPPKKAPEPTTPESTAPKPRPMPESLPTPDFKAPKTETHTLSNGLKVVIASNHEVPLWDLRIAFNLGAHLDPDKHLGLAEISFAMMNEGAGERSSEEMSRALNQMASSIRATAYSDSASIQASGIKRNLEPTIALWADVLQKPQFSSEEWNILKPRWLAKLKNARRDPNAIARRVYNVPLYGNAYRGRIPMESHYNAIKPKDMKAFHRTWVGPENAIVIAGGDVTSDVLIPLLEKYIGKWKPKNIQRPTFDVQAQFPEQPTIFFVDSPGAAQTILRPMALTINRKHEDYFDFKMALDILGGTFTSRVNLNLREDKGYTYGARCFDTHRYGPSIMMCNTAVQTAVTGPAFNELQKELTEYASSRPGTEKELAYIKSFKVNGYPAKYETTDAMLGEQLTMWQFGLPEDWPETFLPNIEGTTLADSNAAFGKHWSLDRTIWLVVGDKETIWDVLQGTGIDIVELDTDGQPVGE